MHFKLSQVFAGVQKSQGGEREKLPPEETSFGFCQSITGRAVASVMGIHPELKKMH